MSPAYGYTTTIEGDVSDSILSKQVIWHAERGYKTIQSITIATHLPFSYAHKSTMHTLDDMPKFMEDYVRCMNWTDAGLGYLLERVDSIPQLSEATIVITGDHSIFWQEKRVEMQRFCDRNHLPWSVSSATCPVLYYSPNLIHDDVAIETPCYQMDIFPTIMYLLDDSEYYWKGLGVNVLDTMNIHNRPISAEDAFLLSDKLIQSDFFKFRP